MRRKEKEIHETDKLEALLAREKICRIGLFDGKYPYIVPMNYGYNEKVLYFHSAMNGRKIEILRKNPLVCFEIDTDQEPVAAEQACGWGYRYRSVIGSGRVEFIESDEEKREALIILMKQQTGQSDWEFAPASFAKTCVFKLVIQEMTGKESGYV